MTEPVRLQLSRRKGFNLQAHSLAVNGLPAVNVARPSWHGNPYIVGKHGTAEECAKYYRGCVLQLMSTGDFTEKYENLRGKNLACWCRLDEPHCHADVLLQEANAPVCEEVAA